MANSKFFEEIKNSIIEREVESVYNKGINLYFPSSPITHPFACDGFIDSKTSNGKIIKMIIEYKFDELLKNKVARAKVLIQVVFYMKQFELNGMILPNICMVGDVNECFVMHTNNLIRYLDCDVDWNIAPSNAYQAYPELVMEIADDEMINPFVFDVDKDFSFKSVVDKINELAENIQRYVHVTEHNVATIYEYFIRNVVKNTKKTESHDLVSIFMGVITNSDEYYQHPTKKNTLVTPLGNIEIIGDSFKSFFSYFQRTYTPQEKNNLTAIADRLIEDTDRRNNGDFWTPTPFVDYAHKMITEQLGENWKDEYVVWDNCCGGLNLTRDYKFKELYCSTLFESELKIGERYNTEATKFQFDFLNDPLEKLPKGLIEAFEQDKKFVFFLNPPYATSANKMGADGSSKEGCAKTKMNQEMLENNFGACSQNLYAQFLYRIWKLKCSYKLTKTYIGIFCPTLFLTGTSYKNFRRKFLSEFSFENAFLMQASEFANVSESWGIGFTILKSIEYIRQNNFNNNCFKYIIIKNNNGELTHNETKIIYNVDKRLTGSDWCNEFTKKLKTFDAPQLTSSIKIKNCGKTMRGRVTNNYLGYFLNCSNNVDMNMQKVSLFSSAYSGGNGISIISSNFTCCTSLFSARKLIEKNWINSKDEYLAPNESHPQWKDFVNDSVIYSLFNTASNQSSLRNIDYKGKKWDIKNEFCWYDINKVKELANENNLDFTYNDANTMEQRFVYKYIREHDGEFSKDALNVLDKANDMLWKSFKYRKLFNEEHPEYQIMNADLGYYQLKALYKEYMKDDLEEFKKLYKVLSDKMRPMVYELGFLK